MPWTCTLKVVKTVNFMLCIFYHNIKENISFVGSFCFRDSIGLNLIYLFVYFLLVLFRTILWETAICIESFRFPPSKNLSLLICSSPPLNVLTKVACLLYVAA